MTLATGARTHALFDSKGSLFACGSGDAGELGNGSTASASTPTPVVGLPSGVKITALTSSWEGSGALLANGDYYNWGYNAAGQLGNGSTANSAVPVKVDLPSPVRAVFQGGSGPKNGQTIAILGDGDTWAWGDNDRGQLGIGTLTNSDVPVMVHVPKGITLRHGELRRLRQLRHRPDRTALGVGRQPQWATGDRFGPTARDPPRGRRDPSHPGVVDGTERRRTRGAHLNERPIRDAA